MSSKTKRSRRSALSSPCLSRLPSTDTRLPPAVGTTAVAAEMSDLDMGQCGQPALRSVESANQLAEVAKVVTKRKSCYACVGYSVTNKLAAKVFIR